MDYTDLFSKAIERKERYDFNDVEKRINATNIYHCGDWDEWADNRWYMLTPMNGNFACYGFICAEYPVALLMKSRPQGLADILNELGILSAEFYEPMSCDEKILKQYVHGKFVFDEQFVDNGDYDFDDVRFELVLERLETGIKGYVDSSCFTMEEIR